MSNNQNNPEIIPYQTFLKRLVIILTGVMIAGFLSLIIFIGYTAVNLKTFRESDTNLSKYKILLPIEGEIKSISLDGNYRLVLLQTEKNISKVFQLSLVTGSIEKEIDLHSQE